MILGRMALDLYYFHDPDGNFGDDINAWIWDALLPGFRTWRADTTLIGIGTILNTQLALPEGRKMVMGSGTGYGHLPPLEPADMWDVRAVRGPLSAERLGLPAEKGIVDPAMMLPRLAEFSDIARDGAKPILIPHCSNTERHDWDAVCARAGIAYVSPRGEARGVIREIARAPLVLAESMHAAIIADAFRTPWIAVSISGTLNRPKWLDWAESLDIDLTVHELFPELSAAIARVRGFKARLTGKSAGAGGAPSGDPRAQGQVQGQGQGRSATKSLQLAIRHGVEKVGIVARLRRALKQPTTLSDAARLADRQDAFEAMLAQVRADYGG